MSECNHDFGMVGVCVKCGASDPRWKDVPPVSPAALNISSLTSPIREAIYMGDRGQECVCSQQGPCYMHAQQERAEKALDTIYDMLSEAHRLRTAIVSALDHWPGGSSYGAVYYSLSDAIGYDPAGGEK